MSWQNRLVGSGTENPLELLANPDNWRIHPEHQQKNLEALLDEVGYVQSVIVNRRSGNLVDGHLRVMLAIRREEPTIPVDYVDLTDDEEKLALATLDPITDMARANSYLFQQLLEQVSTGSAPLMEYLDQFAQEIGAVPSIEGTKDKDGSKELGEGDFGGFKHECPECGFQFD